MSEPRKTWSGPLKPNGSVRRRPVFVACAPEDMGGETSRHSHSMVPGGLLVTS
jgi:hypothetical protein